MLVMGKESFRDKDGSTDKNAERSHDTINLISDFIKNRVLDYPGYAEWRRSKMNIVLRWNEESGLPNNIAIEDFEFDTDFLRHYEAVHSWLRLHTTTSAAKDCEFYFRRYPFHNLPITHEAHLRYICEMWFSRIYEYKERLKTCLNSLNAVLPGPKLDAGALIKSFSQEFEAEIKERNKLHHHRQFDDIMLSKIGITYLMSQSIGDANHDLLRQVWRLEHKAAYREAQKEWSERAKKRGQRLDAYTGAVGDFMVQNMSWLTKPNVT